MWYFLEILGSYHGMKACIGKRFGEIKGSHSDLLNRPENRMLSWD
jgi:hypothetical protein